MSEERRGAALDAVLARFPSARKSGASWKALCPADADKNPSLSIAEKNGNILLHCHAGCSSESVLAALDDETRALLNGDAARKIVETYGYLDKDAVPRFQIVRLDPKDFRPRRPDGKGGWIWNANGVPRILYRLPEVLAADMVLVCEGEKDCETARKLGLVATCNPYGAGKWRDEYSEALRGKSVVIVADNDEAGRKHAQQVATSLHLKAASVKLISVLPMPVGQSVKDLTEWVSHGFEREALLALAEDTPQWSPDESVGNWRKLFHAPTDFLNAPPLSFSIEGFLQNDGSTMIGGLSGHMKTFIMTSVVKALLDDKISKLWDLFRVNEKATRVLYLIPECALSPFAHRLRLMGLLDYTQNERLLVRTLSMGPPPHLDDPALLRAAKGSHVVLDTAMRFADGDESSASDISQGLAKDLFALTNAGARVTLGAHHSPKSFKNDNQMTLENVLRASGDLGAMLSTCWAVKLIDEIQNIVHIENVKPRDFQPCGPFQLVARPYIDETGDFKLHKRPGECGPLNEEQLDNEHNKEKHDQKADRVAMVKSWFAVDSNMTTREMVEKFKDLGIEVKEDTVSRYRSEARKV